MENLYNHIFEKNSFKLTNDTEHSLEFEYANGIDFIYHANRKTTITIVINPFIDENNLTMLSNKFDRDDKYYHGKSLRKYPSRYNKGKDKIHYGYAFLLKKEEDELDAFLKELGKIFDEGDVLIDNNILHELEEGRKRHAKMLSTIELKQRLEEGLNGKVSTRITYNTTFIRNQYVIEYTKRNAEGICELCENKAPFNDKHGDPYLETHHIIWLSKGGKDTIENTAALCPNCHRKMHVVNSMEDVTKLKCKRKN